MDEVAKPRKPVLLHVENDDPTAYLLRRALREIDADVDVFRLCSGEEAIGFLTRDGTFAGAPEPEIVVLDLHLPQKSGHDVLMEIRQQSALRHIPVIMFTASIDPRDRDRSLLLGANEHFYKATDLEGFLEVARQILKHLPA